MDRLDQNRRGLGVDGRLDRLQIIEVDQRHAGEHRLEPLMILFLAGGAKRRHRAAMKGVLHRDDFEAPAVFRSPMPRQLDCRLVDFRAGVGQEHLGAVEQIREALRQPRSRFGVKHVGYVNQLFGLRLDRVYNRGMAMAQTGDRESAEEIKVTVAVPIDKIGAATFHESQRQTSVDVNQVLVSQVDDFCVGHVLSHMAPQTTALGLGAPPAIESRMLWCGPRRAGYLPPRPLRAGRFSSRTLPGPCTTSVPIPERVKVSSKREWSTRPSMICVLATPSLSASIQHSAFGIIPSEIVPRAIRRLARVTSRVETSLLLWSRMPATSVIRISFSALTAEAILPAARSALMLYVSPS